MIYNYGYLKEKADEIRGALPDLIEKDAWDDLRALARISPSMWDGRAADEYDADVLSACGRKDAMLANYLPEIIEMALQRMSCSDEQVAHMITDAFAAFY